MAFEQITVSGITAIASLVGALGGLFAAIAAFRSAGMAKKSTDIALAVERRSQSRELSSVANSIMAETIRIGEIAKELKTAYQTLAAFSGASGGSRINVHIEAVETKKREVSPIQTKAKECIEKREAFSKLGEEEMTAYLADLEGDLIHVYRIKVNLSHELESIEEQNKKYREKAINK